MWLNKYGTIACFVIFNCFILLFNCKDKTINAKDDNSNNKTIEDTIILNDNEGYSFSLKTIVKDSAQSDLYFLVDSILDSVKIVFPDTNTYSRYYAYNVYLIGKLCVIDSNNLNIDSIQFYSKCNGCGDCNNIYELATINYDEVSILNSLVIYSLESKNGKYNSYVKFIEYRFNNLKRYIKLFIKFKQVSN